MRRKLEHPKALLSGTAKQLKLTEGTFLEENQDSEGNNIIDKKAMLLDEVRFYIIRS